MVLRNFGILLQYFTASKPGRPRLENFESDVLPKIMRSNLAVRRYVICTFDNKLITSESFLRS